MVLSLLFFLHLVDWERLLTLPIADLHHFSQLNGMNTIILSYAG